MFTVSTPSFLSFWDFWTFLLEEAWFWGVGFGGRKGALASALIYVTQISSRKTKLYYMNELFARKNMLYTRYPIVARALGQAAAFRPSASTCMQDTFARARTRPKGR